MSEHTKTPWEYYVATMGGDEIAVIHPQGEPDDYRICTVFDEAGGGTSPEANACQIVHCVNNHERLVEALREFRDSAEAAHKCRYSGGDLNQALARQEIAERKADELLAALEAEKGGEL